MSSNVLIVVGSDPGIGATTGSIFAKQKFKKVRFIQERAGENVEVRTYSVDITHTDDFLRVLRDSESLGQMECLFYNPARVVPSELLKFPSEEVLYDFKAIPLLQRLPKQEPASKPSILVPNSDLYKDPVPPLLALSLTKTAQRSLVLSLSKTYGKDVHIALVSANGPVNLTNKKLNPSYIAAQAWELYNQEKGHWTNEIEIVED
ncbi:hypothetical protein P152DRAFT_502112 [Eremomyces bilateralis CBS 781.70]|uniref:NAD(P)-binding protein n=1 Tax=Eremomyces bilateralis CBS 781.70 TaxID=1392243 RepID=A0A6G1G512_9PEZI|nr:uncharacterized protein P152DRAFT_502112 [Eremomyces bilateralis CBS 781.70]KAF1813108.1 hypothetical protein P152DRAFT_502112 [Eremomyces bilateralis CBS 781.70]